jgi:prolyl-tRNA synthetase
MTHSDDDGLVLPPKLAPKQIVILPIIKNDEERESVMEFCRSLEADLKAQRYGEDRLRILIDDRDLRGGEKKWHHVKRGVPIRVEVGARDIAKESVFVGRRDQPKSTGMTRADFVGSVVDTLAEIQQGLFDRALAMQKEHTKTIDSFEEFKKYFTPKNEKKPGIHGGFAECFFVDCDEVDEMLKPLKVTPRCIPVDQEEASGTCIFTGKPTTTKGIFAKSY